MALCVCVCRRDSGWGGLVRLILSHTDNGLLSHTPDGLWERERVCLYLHAGRSQDVSGGRLTHGCTEGGIPNGQIVLPFCTIPLSPLSSSARSPSPTIMHSIYLIKAPSLLSGW